MDATVTARIRARLDSRPAPAPSANPEDGLTAAGPTIAPTSTTIRRSIAEYRRTAPRENAPGLARMTVALDSSDTAAERERRAQWVERPSLDRLPSEPARKGSGDLDADSVALLRRRAEAYLATAASLASDGRPTLAREAIDAARAYQAFLADQRLPPRDFQPPECSELLRDARVTHHYKHGRAKAVPVTPGQVAHYNGRHQRAADRLRARLEAARR